MRKRPKQYTVLIAEDDQIIGKMYEKKFSLEGFKTMLALDGETAIKLALIHKPDIIFLDTLMPKISGLQILQTLKKLPFTAKIPIIILADSDQKEINQVKKMGAKAYLIKSQTTPQKLVAIAQKTLAIK